MVANQHSPKFMAYLLVKGEECGLEGDFSGGRGDGHGVFLMRFGCLFVSGNLTLKLWHDLRFLASKNVRRNALFARIYLVMERGLLA